MKKTILIIYLLLMPFWIIATNNKCCAENYLTEGYFIILPKTTKGINGDFIKLDNDQILIMSKQGDLNKSYIYDNKDRSFTPINEEKYLFETLPYWSYRSGKTQIDKPNTQVGIRLNDGNILLITHVYYSYAFDGLEYRPELYKWKDEQVYKDMKANPCKQNEIKLLKFLKEKDLDLFKKYLSFKEYLEEGHHAHLFDPKAKTLETLEIPPLKAEQHLYKMLLPNGNVLIISEKLKKSAIYDYKEKKFRMLPDNHKINGYENYIMLSDGKIFMTKDNHRPYLYDIEKDQLISSNDVFIGQPSEIPVKLQDDRIMFIMYGTGDFNPIQCYNPKTNEVKTEGYLAILERKGNDVPVLLNSGKVIIVGEHKYLGGPVYEYGQEIYNPETSKTSILKNIVQSGYNNVWNDAIVMDSGEVLIRITSTYFELYIPKENPINLSKREYKRYIKKLLENL